MGVRRKAPVAGWVWPRPATGLPRAAQQPAWIRFGRERTRGRAADQGDKRERGDCKQNRQPEAIDVGKRIGLALHGRRKRPQSPRRRQRRAVTAEPAGELRENVVHVDAAIDDMLAKKI